LPEDAIAQLHIQPDRLLSSHAFKTYQLLKAHFIDTNGVEEVGQWSVYRCARFNLPLADRRWDTGFRDVDEVDELGRTLPHDKAGILS
jgi:hypothetical protein